MRFPEDIDAHWIAVQSHIHRNATHGFALERAGWSLFGWRCGNSGAGIAIPRPNAALGYPILAMTELESHGDFDSSRWIVQTADHQDAALANGLAHLGFECTYTMPIWALFPKDLDAVTEHSYEAACRNHDLMPLVEIKLVDDTQTLDDFVHVQHLACRETWGWTLADVQGFYGHLESLVGRHTAAFILYLDGRPVRTVVLYVFEGIASIGGGACVPSERGRHLGNFLVQLALEEAFERGVEMAVGFSQPTGTPVGKRYCGSPLLQYRQWRKTNGVLVDVVA